MGQMRNKGMKMPRLAILAIFAAVSIAIPAIYLSQVSPATAVEPIAQETKIQVGPWYPAPFNIEEPYINIIHASSVSWTSDGKSTQDLYDSGIIDKETGLPVRQPGGKTITSGVYFTGNDPVQNLHWDGEWVLEWEGDADLWMLFISNDLQWKVSPNRLEFTRDYKRGKTPYHAAIQVRKLNGPLKSIRLYRKENEPALKSGKIYNPVFSKAVARYDIVRTMDLQQTNSANIRSVDDLPSNDAPFWGNSSWHNEGNIHHPFRSAPIEPMFALATETDTELWTHVPITLGMPVDFYDPSVVREQADQWAGAYRSVARENAAEILASPEWDKYADAFVAALIESGYPADRPLYTTVANEVWNFAGQYFLTTQYAWGIGEGLAQTNGEALRAGYGALLARWKFALGNALKRAGREQELVYVVEGQAAYVDRTRTALEGAKAYLASRGQDWTKHAPEFGVSVASYWGAAPDDLKRDGVDPTDLAAMDRWFLTGPANSVSTLPWILAQWKAHQAAAKPFGVRLIGAYEGGSHFERPKELPEEAYERFMWGASGAKVNRAVNDALAKEFPGTILSNYVLAGPTGGQPWFEGPLAAENPYERSWEPYLRP